MATLYRKKGYQTWTARLCIGGKRKDRCTQTSTRREANRFAEAWEVEERKAAAGDTSGNRAILAILDRAAGMAREGTLNLIPAPGGAHMIKRSFHSIRHTYSSLLAEADIPTADRQLVMGHASAVQNNHYTHLSPAKRLTVARAIPRLVALPDPVSGDETAAAV